MRTFLSLILLITLGHGVLPAHADAPRQLYVQPSALLQVVETLKEAPVQSHMAFASLTLEAMVQAYEEELGESGLARGADAARDRRLDRWRQATALQLRELDQAWQWLNVAEEVRVRADRQGQVMLLLDGRPVLVSWPRMRDQARREAELLQRFCADHPCGETRAQGTARAVQGTDWVNGAWSFSQDRRPGWESETGVRCEYPDLRDREAREAQCRALALELDTLARVLAQVQREGGRIEWQTIRVHEEPGGGQRVTVNAREDFLLLPLEAVSRHSLDWRATQRWLERRVRGVHSAETVLPAGAQPR
ncbi:hypothetical protein [Thioalkalivibrio sulfidiphilus]|uniref:hypothetical protein n=1 Tax=Thioalkalivibrio sulfidiphilus TaxID=1033854 RepID=UPI003B31D62F